MNTAVTNMLLEVMVIKNRQGFSLVEVLVVLVLLGILMGIGSYQVTGLMRITQDLVDRINGPQSPLGTGFAQISENMVALMQDYRERVGSYPRSWGNYRFTDIGLKPADWQKAYGNIHYTPSGDRVQIKPEEGYTFWVRDVEGSERSLSSNLNWNLVYSLQDGIWYYHSVGGDRIDIATLRVVKS